MSSAKLLTSGGGGVILQPASSIASDVTVNLPVTAGTLDRLNRAGNVLQVVQSTTRTTTTINTSTFTDTSLSASITPSSTSSKILVFISQQVRNAAANPTTLGCRIRLLRGSTNILSLSGENTAFDTFEITADGGGNTRIAGYINFNYLDSPSSTSSVTYKTQASTSAGAHSFQNDSSISMITLMEIAA